MVWAPCRRVRSRGDASSSFPNPENRGQITGGVRRADVTPPSDERLLDVLERGRRLGFLGPGPVGAHLDHALGLGTILDSVLAGAMPVVDGPVVDGPVLDLGAGG